MPGVKSLLLVIGLALGGATGAAAQLAISRPTTRLLILPLDVAAPADSAASVATMDAARERLAQLARYKVIVIPKRQICDALQASGFGCDLLLSDEQANQLARLVEAQGYTTGTLSRRDGALTARIRVVDRGGSGFAFAFTATAAAPGTPDDLGDAVAQRLNTLVRAGEHARECSDKRARGEFSSALDAARKALALEPDLPAAHLCVAIVYEAQRLPPDSLIAAARRATRGDSLDPRAWETMARAYQIKGDTAGAIDAFEHELAGEPKNVQLRLALAERLRQREKYARAVAVLDSGLALSPTNAQLLDLRSRVCIEGQMWRCTLEGFIAQARADSSRLADSSFLKAALGAAQQVPDTEEFLRLSRAAVRHFPASASFWKALGQAFQLDDMADSAVAAYRKSLALDPSDVNASLLVVRTLVDHATYDTATARRLKTDSAALDRLRTAFADQLDTARAYLRPALAAGDSAQQLSAAVILLTGGSKLAQAGAYDRAYPWLERALDLVTPRAPGDTLGPRQQVRLQASFWYGVASVQPLFQAYGAMVRAKSCTRAKTVNDWIARAKAALIAGRRVHPPTVDTMLQNLAKLEAIMPQVKQQFHCHNF
jgi:tetratricopeptide (TPR) repeat protein